MVTCMSWRRSAGSTKRVVAQRPAVSGIGAGAIVLLVGDHRVGGVEALDRLVGLADPVEAGRGRARGCAALQRLPGGM